MDVAVHEIIAYKTKTAVYSKYWPKYYCVKLISFRIRVKRIITKDRKHYS